MKKSLTKLKILTFLLFIPIVTWSQTSASGKIVNAKGEGVPFVTVIEKGTSNGTTSAQDGSFQLNVSKLPTNLVASFIGFKAQTINITTASGNTISLVEESVGLDEVIVTGNRAKPRTVLDSPVPIDNIGVSELKSSGQTSIDQMLTYKVPSYNSSNQTISDATAHFDPADLRGLGPSRTLVLVNGKRKNQSALVYINDTPGKGEVGTDMKSIPTAAIERVEVLRDGASAQYGSDAIAGVINIILKKNVEYTTLNVNSGITTEGDGFNIGADINSTLSIGNNGGYANFTLAYYQQELTNRAGEPGGDGLFGVIFGDDAILNGTLPWLQENPDMGMTIGQPEMKKGELFYNMALPFKNDSGEFYAFGGLNTRKGTSFALYRTPYWVPDPHNLLHDAGTEYQGFQPTFETDITDFINSIGVKFDFFGFNADLSGTFGINTVDYTVGNTLNPDLGAASPTNFNAGGYSFSNLIANFDVSKSYGDISIAFGAEARKEVFKAEAGEPDSYFGGGAQSFPGIQPANAVNEDRTNYGVYAGLDWDVTDEFLIGGAVRYEDFSDFGSNSSWKVSGRYKLGSKGAIRASYGTGFRAPSLHQIYLSNIQTLVSGGTISNQGTFNNVDPVIRDGLGVPQLHAEESKNISAGITYKPTNNLSFSLDFYNIKVDDRVLFSGEVGFDGDDGTTNPVEVILNDFSVTSIKFFINAVNTETNGADFMASYSNIELGGGSLAVNFAGNINDTKIKGEIATPQVLADNDYDIFNRKEQARITDSRPKTKLMLGFDYELDKFSAQLNNTYFGEVTWQHASDPANDQTFGGKVVTDLNFGYNLSEKVAVSLSVNNLLNVYPDAIETNGDFVTDLGGRFKYPWEVNQFGFNGTILKAGVSYKF
ncbi:MAG: TonB-dependent receptor plug domain-containing protein [Lutibacter sp.]|uniref:TonB-dependent receptor n=1 Tax=Lutibacter sp. TaxID=1925666 RepID=UPI001A09CB7E|nr:TonB-dependent receptor [Lutibacter sp.]NOR26941.1 TonB-dependent receptor plug domain-containing protein [Lutibacter sp.]